MHRWLLLAALASLPASADEAEDSLRATMSEKLGDGARFRRAGPFLAAGRLDAAAMDRHQATLERCRKQLADQFFAKPVPHLVAVYLFDGKDPYEEFCQAQYGSAPSSPYGFYRRSDHVMVMNIATGSGRMVHEMTHALMDVDFPEAPTWFSEGLASLFEQSTTREGKIVGLENWRLPQLQDAISEGTAPKLEELTATSTLEFYGEGFRLRYGAARYLCMYLQEKGLLEGYYKKFRDGVKEDPTGWKTLKGMFEQPFAEVEKDYRRWVSALEAPR